MNADAATVLAGLGPLGIAALLLLWGSVIALIVAGLAWRRPHDWIVRPDMNTNASEQRSLGRTSLLIIGAALAVVVLLVGVIALRPRPSAPPSAQAPVPHFVDVAAPGAPRTVVIGGAYDRLPGTSNDDGYLMANLYAGQLPAGAAEAVILSDTNCAPDADGISHCLNDLQIGSVIVTVQHHHDMTAVPCLSPGETVRLMPLEQYRAQL